MANGVRILLLLASLALAGACVVGFLATFEPLDAGTRFVWRLVYTLGALLSTASAVLIFIRMRREERGDDA